MPDLTPSDPIVSAFRSTQGAIAAGRKSTDHGNTASVERNHSALIVNVQVFLIRWELYDDSATALGNGHKLFKELAVGSCLRVRGAVC